jgi:hypothetical protein
MRVSGLPAVVLCTFSCWGAAPAIGTSDNGPVWDGTAVEAGTSASTISLENGVSVRLAPQSRGTVFSDHIVLDEGSVRVGNFGTYTVNARQLQVQAADPSAQAVVRLGTKTVEIASIGGNLNVSDGGAMLSRIVSGTRVSFKNGGGQTPTSKKALPSDQHIMIWMIAITGAAAVVIGATAAAQGKSPF